MVRLLLASLLLFSGAATYYPAERFAGRPLYCDQFVENQKLIYAENAEPWLALDVSWYESGRVQCGDLVLVMFEDGQQLLARAWDAGRFQDRWVVDFGPDVPIVVDLPEHLKPAGGAWRVMILTWGGWP